MFTSWIITVNMPTDNFLNRNWIYFIIGLFCISVRNHYRSLLYDLEIETFDNLNTKSVVKAKVKTIELKVETEE